MNRKCIFSILAALAFAAPSAAQTVDAGMTAVSAEGKTAKLKAFNNLELTINAGSTGIGFDVATYVHKMVRVRTGFDFMPKFNYTMNFAIAAGRYDEAGNWIESNFNSMADKLEQLTGYKADQIVGMNGEPTFTNYKLLVDVFPFKNKNWYFTAGFYVGKSRIAKAYNKTEEMPSLLAVSIYNNIYDKVINQIPIYGDAYLDPAIEDMIINFGRMGINVGTMKSTGKAYMMEPDADGMVKADLKVNSFRPFIGFGYTGRLVKNDDRYTIGFDCGAMFWGGTPAILTHDGTNLTKDVTNIYYSVGDYVDIIKSVKVFPVLNLRIARKLF